MTKNFIVSKKIIFIINLLCVAGFFVAFHLAWLHYQIHANPSFHSFCAMSDSFNCETVAESPYSVFLGVPNAVWGMLGYLFMFLLALFGVGRYQSSGAYLALLAACAFSVLTSILLAIVSYCIICSFCIMCSVTYGINIVMVGVLVWEAVRRKLSIKESSGELVSIIKRNWVLYVSLVLVVLLLCFVFPDYWSNKKISSVHKQGEPNQDITSDGHHWIGAANPTAIVNEYSDYLCLHCRRAHKLQRALVLLNSEKLRLIHRHFPLDDACNPLIKSPFHPGACLLAQAAICAGEQGGFWEMNDLLYDHEALSGTNWQQKIEDAAYRVGLDLSDFKSCLNSTVTIEKLRKDIDEGLRLKLRGTPSFALDDKVYVGMIDSTVLQQLGLSLQVPAE